MRSGLQDFEEQKDVMTLYICNIKKDTTLICKCFNLPDNNKGSYYVPCASPKTHHNIDH